MNKTIIFYLKENTTQMTHKLENGTRSKVSAAYRAKGLKVCWAVTAGDLIELRNRKTTGLTDHQIGAMENTFKRIVGYVDAMTDKQIEAINKVI